MLFCMVVVVAASFMHDAPAATNRKMGTHAVKVLHKNGWEDLADIPYVSIAKVALKNITNLQGTRVGERARWKKIVEIVRRLSVPPREWY